MSAYHPARERIALAADLPLPEAEGLYAHVSAYVGWVKVGLSLFVERGPAAVEAFSRRGARVFLDLKLHDIPNTVELAAHRAGQLGVALLTVHAQGGEAMLRAAVKGAREGAQRAGREPPKVLAVTVLTSLADPDLSAIGAAFGTAELVPRLSKLALEAGVDGLVCSAQEVPRLRSAFGPTPLLVTPGIRPAGGERGDQARVETPAAALRAGADVLVIGRPIHAAADPVAAARAICEELAS